MSGRELGRCDAGVDLTLRLAGLCKDALVTMAICLHHSPQP